MMRKIAVNYSTDHSVYGFGLCRLNIGWRKMCSKGTTTIVSRPDCNLQEWQRLPNSALPRGGFGRLRTARRLGKSSYSSKPTVLHVRSITDATIPKSHWKFAAVNVRLSEVAYPGPPVSSGVVDLPGRGSLRQPAMPLKRCHRTRTGVSHQLKMAGCSQEL
jgi:hypothetical protein